MQAEPEFATLEGRALHRASWLVVAGHPEAMASRQAALENLIEAGHAVSLIYFDRLSANVMLPVPSQRISAADRVPQRVRRAARVLELTLRPGPRLKLALRGDTSLSEVISRAQHVLLLDDRASSAQRPLRDHNATARYWQPKDVDEVLEEERWWRYLDRRLHQLRGHLLRPIQTKGLMEAIAWVAALEPQRLSPPPDLHRHARTMIHRFIGRGRVEDARLLLEVCQRAEREVAPGDDAAAFTALRTHLQLHDEQFDPEALQGLLADVFASADAALAGGAPRDAAGRASIGLDLMFHPRLHTDVPSTPLVESPDTFTAPLYGSEVGQLLTGPVPVTTAEPGQSRTTSAGPVKVTYLPGAYPWHAKHVLSALDADPRADLSVLRLEDAAFQGMSVGEFFVSYRLSRALPELPQVPSPADPDLTAQLARADVVVADWADKGALWASLELPAGARMVVRVHSADVLSAGVHLVDWSRVSDVICVSEHLRQVFLALLGERTAHLRVHVIPNVIAPPPSQPHAPADGRTIAMVGWGQKVKDPAMALDILAALRTRDPAWRLRLIGADFGPSNSALVNDYSTAFRRRAVKPDLLESIDFVPQTDDVPRALAGSSFILSTSVRESFHIGAMEGIAAGAVPVIREWPAFAKYHGAAGLFPSWAIFDTVDEAVEIIWSLRDPAERQAALERARESMRAVLDGQRAIEQLLDVILR